MGLGKDYAAQDCSFARTLEVVGERWTLLVVRDAFYGVRRFGDFLVHLDIPRAVLADRLNTLVEHDVLAKERYQESPPRDEYVLTEAGRELWPALFLLGSWGHQHLPSVGNCWRTWVHAGCGGALTGPSVCSECGAAVPARDVLTDIGTDNPRRRTDRVSVALREPRRLLEPLLAGAHA